MIIIRKAVPEDKKEYAVLTLMAAPFFPVLFGCKIYHTVQDLFKRNFNLFSFEHVCFAEVNGEKAGMVLGYDWKIKKRESLRTGLLLLKNAGLGLLGKASLLMKFNKTVGMLHDGEYYISNIALYPQYRGMTVGKRLILKAESEARRAGAVRMALDVNKESSSAINFYSKLGYRTLKELIVPLQKDNVLYFKRMVKELK